LNRNLRGREQKRLASAKKDSADCNKHGGENGHKVSAEGNYAVDRVAMMRSSTGGLTVSKVMNRGRWR